MGTLILTASLDTGCVAKLTDHYGPPRHRILNLKADADIFSCIRTTKPQVVLVGAEGRRVDEKLQLIRKIKSLSARLPIVLINQFSSEARAVAAFRAGVDDYFKQPVPYDQLIGRIDKLLEKVTAEAGGNGTARDETSWEMIGKSRVMQKIKAHLTRVAATKSTVLITGETGTGKELAATMIHRFSRRRRGPFVCINCAALPEHLVESELFGYKKGAFTGAVGDKKGKFEQATGGTLFLDEIGDMTPYSQAKILRSLESKHIIPLGAGNSKPLNVRFIAATNQALEQLVSSGRFRPDLYYRLNVAKVHIPPLRERKEDIPGLAAYVISRMNRRFNRRVEGLTDEALMQMMRYRWPGNVRELINLIESAFINLSSRRITRMSLPAQFCQALKQTADQSTEERAHIISALKETNWNKSNAAQKLKWSRMTLYRKMAKYKITTQRRRDAKRNLI